MKSAGPLSPAPSVLLADQEVVHRLARSKLCPQPAGLFTATRPSLGRIFRIPVFGKDLRVRALSRSDLVQPLLKSGLSYHQFASQFRGCLLMKLPQFVDGHQIQIALFFHWTHRP